MTSLLLKFDLNSVLCGRKKVDVNYEYMRKTICYRLLAFRFRIFNLIPIYIPVQALCQETTTQNQTPLSCISDRLSECSYSYYSSVGHTSFSVKSQTQLTPKSSSKVGVSIIVKTKKNPSVREIIDSNQNQERHMCRVRADILADGALINSLLLSLLWGSASFCVRGQFPNR